MELSLLVAGKLGSDTVSIEPGLKVSPESTSCSLFTNALLLPAAFKDTVMANVCVCGGGEVQ